MKVLSRAGMHTSIAGLSVTVVAEKGPLQAAAVLCHGFGAPGTDLVGLAQELRHLEPKLDGVRFYFPSGPLSLDSGWGDSRAWWLIDVEAISQSRTSLWREKEPEGLAAARASLRALVDEVAITTKLGVPRIIVGGFSQGAMIATDLAFRLEERPLGLVILSGTLLLEPLWRAKAKARPALPVFQSHGTADPILRFADAEALRAMLTESGLTVDWVSFNGGHGIAPKALAGMASFMARQLG